MPLPGLVYCVTARQFKRNIGLVFVNSDFFMTTRASPPELAVIWLLFHGMGPVLYAE